MATEYTVLFNAFKKRVERDRDFFAYLHVYQPMADEIVEERCKGFLDEACGRLMLEGQPSVDFSERDDDLLEFGFDLTPIEKYLIPSLMYESYLSREIAYLKTLTVNYAPADVKVFDPSNWRSTFYQMYSGVCAENARLLEEYRSKDRKSGRFLGVDFASVDA